MKFMPSQSRSEESDAERYPGWFGSFLADRAIVKPSPHTAKAYRQDFEAIAVLLCGGGARVTDLRPSDLTKDALHDAFGAYAGTHSAASIRRCWSTWNMVCTFLYTNEMLSANPMPLIGRPKVPKSLPKSLGVDTVSELISAIDNDRGSVRRSDWAERDRALVFTALLTGLRADELIKANVGDIRITNDGAVIAVHGKGNKDRHIPVGPELVNVLTDYLESRQHRFPSVKRRGQTAGPTAWPATAPLFVGSNGERITRGTLQYRVLRAFRKAGLNSQRARGVLVHGLRHTFATELANENISVYTLMKLLSHESMVTSQRYVDGAATETRAAAAQNPLYRLLQQ